MPSLPNFANLEGSEFNLSADAIELSFSSDDGAKHQISVSGGCVGALILSLLQRGRERAGTLGRQSEEQPLRLLDATALNFENGVVGIMLQIESDLRFPFALTPTATANLKAALASAEDIAKPRSGSAH